MGEFSKGNFIWHMDWDIEETISKVHLLGGNELRLVAHSLSGSEHGLLELCGTVSLEAQPNIHWQDGEIWLRK